MDAPLRRVASILLVATAALAAAAATPELGGSQTDPSSLRRDADALASQSRSAVLELYALETRLAASQARLAKLRTRSDALTRERASVSARLAIARRTLRTSELLLAHRVRALYERGEPDPLALVLGAESLEEAMAAIDGLALAAAQDQAIIERTRSVRGQLAGLSTRLRSRGTELEQLVADAAAETAALDGARAERSAYVEQLASQRRLTAARLAELEAAAAAAGAVAHELSPQGPTPVVAPSARTVSTVAGPGTLTVTASGYALAGTTATGVPTGWGVVAVDPSVIPLGTRMTIPGYGEGVAADTGPGIQGASIDLWFPSEAEARAWGRRTVTITLG